MLFICYPKCSTCQKARKWLEAKGISYAKRHIKEQNPTVDELKAFYDTNTYYIIRGGGYGLSYFPHELNCWQTFDETIEVPATANYFVFGINSYYGTAIYIDDITGVN